MKDKIIADGSTKGLGIKHIENPNITFYSPTKEVLKLTPEGFEYNGEIIKDAGKAYNLFIEFMEKANGRRTDESRT